MIAEVTGMKEIMEYLPVLLPVILAELVLAVTALIHVLRHDEFKVGNKIIWVLVVLFIQIIGPIAYFLFGRGDE